MFDSKPGFIGQKGAVEWLFSVRLVRQHCQEDLDSRMLHEASFGDWIVRMICLCDYLQRQLIFTKMGECAGVQSPVGDGSISYCLLDQLISRKLNVTILVWMK